MAVAMRSKLAGSSAVARQTRSVKVVCQAGAMERVQVAAASAVVAALLAAPVHAGVIIQQPQLKKLFQDDGSSAAAVTSSSSSVAKPSAKAPAPKAAKSEEESSLGGDIDPRAIALPGSIVLVGAGLAAAYKLDSGFADFFQEAMAKDSNNFAGYEPVLKPEGGYIGTGTKKVKAAGTKKGKK